jgi:hypothetical protein
VRRAGLIAAVVLGVVVAAGAVTWLVAFRDTTEPVSVEEAVTSFRTDTEPTARGPSPIPEGVYVYATIGYEKTDALTGVTHRYPRRSTITVAAHECGVSLTWRVLEGRSTEWVYCVTADGWELRSQDERHTFFGRTERTTYACENTPIRPATAHVGTRWDVSCRTDGAVENGTGSVVGRVAWSLRGGPSRTELLIRKRSRFMGEIRGTAGHDLAFDTETGLLSSITMVSRTTTDSPIGDVRYDENVTLALLSLEPRR